MPKDLLDIAPFLSPEAPRENLVDYSASISKNDHRAIEQLSSQLNYKAKIVVLPTDFSVGGSSEFDHFARALAEKWHVAGNRFLLVVDLKGHHVRGLSGEELQAAGVDSSYISILIKDQFIPLMKKGDLSGAIQKTLSGVSEKVQEASSTASSANDRSSATQLSSGTASPVMPVDNPTHTTQISLSSLFIFFFAVVIAIVWYIKAQQRKKAASDSKKLFDELKDRLAVLYERADLIGQASEYLKPDEQRDLAKSIADFFNKLGALSATQNQLERLQGKIGLAKSNDDLRRICKMVDALEPESVKLLNSVNESTGSNLQVVESPDMVARRFEREAELAVQREKDQERKDTEAAENARRLEEERFRRPSWAYEPSYYQPVTYNSDPMSGLSNLMLTLNQMQLEDRVDRMNYEMHRESYFDNSSDKSYGDSGGGWGNSDSSYDSGSWGSDSGSSDSGGDFSGGDGGGDW